MMSKHEEFYTPEQVDEQIDAFLQERNRSTRDQRLASDLQSMLTRPDDSSSLQRVWQKLMQDKSATRQQGSIIPPLADRHLKHQERSVPMDKPMKRSTPMQLAVRIFSTLAAVVVVVFLVGSLLLVLNASHQKPANTTTAGSHAAPESKTPPARQVFFRSKPFPALAAVAWSPDGTRTALVVEAASDPNKLQVESVDALTGQHALAYTTVTDANVFIAWSPDGSQLAVTEGTRLAVFDAKTAKQLHTFSTPSVALSSGHTPSLVSIQVIALGSFVKLSGGTAPGLNGVAWSPDGKFLAAISNGHQNEISVWDTTTGSVLKTLTGFGSLDTSSFLRSLIWSPDGHQLGLIAGNSSSGSDEVQIVDTTAWQAAQHYPNTDEFSWGPDGKQLALVDSDKNNPGKDIRIVDTQSGQTVKSFAERVQKDFDIYGIYWSPDGTRIALDTMETKTTATAGHTTFGIVELWSVADGKLLSKFDQNTVMYASSWSPDSKYILTVVMDNHTANDIHAYVIWNA